jgi:golgi phosphoprotein 3
MTRRRAQSSTPEGKKSVQQLTLADEIVVLMLDDDSGEMRSNCLPIAPVAIAGGVLMELALQGRVDSDLNALFVVNPAPTGDALLDETLAEIAAEGEQHPSGWWIAELPVRHPDMIEQMLARLVAAGILREEEFQILWVFSQRAYPQVSGREEREAKARLMSVLFSDEVPEPRDALLLGLANASGALGSILTEDEMDKAAIRIAEVAALEEIGRSVGAVANQTWTTVASIMTGYTH